MLATVTSKGQVTLPKPIRDRLHIVAGSRLEFEAQADGSIIVRPLSKSAKAIIGLLARPGAGSATIAQMNDAIGSEAAARHPRTKAR